MEQVARVPLSGVAHIGIRVHDLERSLAFYRVLGFEKTVGPVGPEPVAILMHPAGIEINLVLNAPDADTPNVLMDVPLKAPGITHVALSCPDIEAAGRALKAAGYVIKDGPVRFPTGAQAIFVRDPDGVVIELNQPPHASHE
jgi:lactoylglutathione lyase